MTSEYLVVRSALTPGRPGASPTGGADRDSGVKVDAIENQRDAALVGVEEARGARRGAMLADAGVHDARFVERAAGLPHAFEPPIGGVIVRPRHDVDPIDLRSRATAGAPMIQTPPNSACGTAGVRAESIAVPSKLPNAASAS